MSLTQYRRSLARPNARVLFRQLSHDYASKNRKNHTYFSQSNQTTERAFMATTSIGNQNSYRQTSMNCTQTPTHLFSPSIRKLHFSQFSLKTPTCSPSAHRYETYHESQSALPMIGDTKIERNRNTCIKRIGMQNTARWNEKENKIHLGDICCLASEGQTPLNSIRSSELRESACQKTLMKTFHPMALKVVNSATKLDFFMKKNSKAMKTLFMDSTNQNNNSLPQRPINLNDSNRFLRGRQAILQEQASIQSIVVKNSQRKQISDLNLNF